MDANITIKDMAKVDSFNPRARDGREDGLTHTMHDLKVSIHAPVMDAKRRSLELNV